jgi:hypothetical protein
LLREFLPLSFREYFTRLLTLNRVTLNLHFPPKDTFVMYQSSLRQSPVKEGRRILSEKNANACLSPARSPAKQTLLNAPSPSPKKLLPSPLFAPSFVAQKRSITEVDAEDAGSQLPESGNERRVDIGHESDAMSIDVSEQTRQQEGEQGDIATSRTVPSDPETRKQFIQEVRAHPLFTTANTNKY